MDSILPIVEERMINVAGGSAEVVMSLEDMIKTNLQKTEQLKEDIKKHNDMLKDGVENNPIYREHADKAKEYASVRTGTKNQIMAQPAMRDLAQKVKDMRTELREKKASLSDYLLEYQRLTAATQLELFDGSTVQIVKTARVVKTG